MVAASQTVGGLLQTGADFGLNFPVLQVLEVLRDVQEQLIAASLTLLVLARREEGTNTSIAGQANYF